MSRAHAMIAVALAACASGSADHSGDAAAGSDDAGAADARATGDGGPDHGDASPGDGGAGDGGSTGVPLHACTDAVELDGPLPSALDVTSYGSYGDPPLLLTGDTTRVIYGATSSWMAAAHGTAQTSAAPAVVAASAQFAAQRAMSGRVVGLFLRGSQTYAAAFDGTSFGAAIAVPCTAPQPYYQCQARAAGDGHLWIRANQVLHEQVGGNFAERGGAPISIEMFDVDAEGNVWVGGAGVTAGEVFQIWELPRGAGGWTKTGALLATTVAPAAATIEGGLALDTLASTFAPDGSIHLWSSARCVGTGLRNKTQLYLRSRDGVTWDIETLPDLGTLVDGQVTWANEQGWASDYDNARVVDESSPPPVMQPDGTWSYPNRQLNVLSRCLDGTGQPAFARVAKAPLPGWTIRGFARFSDTGAVTLLTSLGLTQIYP